MSTKSKSSSTRPTRRKKAHANGVPLEIRKANSAEAFYITGNAVLRQSMVIQEHIDIGYNIGQQYRPVADAVANALAGWTQPVIFYQAVSESGKEFVLPQVLWNGLNDEDWKACGREGFLLPAWHWLQFEVCSDCDEVSWDIGLPVSGVCFSHLEFTKRLSEVLAPSVIDTMEHPLIIRVKSLFCSAQVEHDNGEDM